TNFATANGRTSEPLPTPVGGALGALGDTEPDVEVDVDADDGELNALLIWLSAFLPALTASSTGMPMITAATTSDTNVVIGLRPLRPTERPAETLDSCTGGRPDRPDGWAGGGVHACAGAGAGLGAGGGATAWGAASPGRPSGVHDGTPSGVGPGIG